VKITSAPALADRLASIAPALPPGSPREGWRARRAALEAAAWRSTPDGIRPYAWRRWFDPGVRVAGFMARAGGLHGRGVRNALDVRLNRLDLALPALPEAFDGTRVLHVTDPHFDAVPGLGDAVVRAVAGLSVDLVLLTGDYRCAAHGPFVETGILEPLAGIVGAVASAEGFFACLGNHDTHEMVAPMEGVGLTVLVNETVTITRGGQRLSITGVDDVYRFYTPDALAALGDAGGFGPGHFGIAMVHSPELAGEAAAAGHGLYLCGHTHGGQICPPTRRPVFALLNRNHHLASGLWRHGGMVGYTSRGAGVSGLPLRYYNEAEVTLITLRRGGARH
jgi:predicted MPP superfamily phosphohydrolase